MFLMNQYKKSIPCRPRLILQSEAAECGLACLAMIAAAWDRDISLEELRARTATSSRGLRLTTLIDIAGDLGFAARGVRIGLNRLADLSLPAILHWDLGHFVVLEKVGARHITILDPASSRRKMTLEEASPHFTGVALELTVVLDFNLEKSDQSVSRISFDWVWEGRLGSALRRVAALTALLQFSVLALPFLFRHLIDQASVQGLPYALFIGCLLVIGLQAFTSWLRSLTVIEAGSLFTYRLASSVIYRLFNFPVNFFYRRSLGDILSKVRAVEVLRRFATDDAAMLVVDAFASVLTAIAMILFSPRLAAVVCVSIFLEAALRVFSARPLRNRLEALLDAESRETGRLVENLRAIEAIKLAGREAQRHALWETDYVRLLNSSIKMQSLKSRISGAIETIVLLELMLVLWFAIFQSVGPVSTGVLFGFLSYRELLRQRMASVLQRITDFQFLLVYWARLKNLLASEEESMAESRPAISSPHGEIDFSEISFRYGTNEAWVFDRVSLSVPACACVALVGPSGVGKSTLIKLLLQLEQPTSGAILIDGRPLSEMDPKHWRRIVGTVMQHDQLLSGSISDNIAFFDTNVDEHLIQHCASAAGIAAEIEAMPMGYETLIGDMGIQLSGGQRQRLLIARALYRRPKIIVFDEGTSGLDADNELKIMKTLKALDITRVIVAHRSKLIEAADIVYELRDGAVQRVR